MSINLFHIENYLIDTSKLNSLLHDKIVTEYEENFAEYVGAKYAVSFNSATSAIFLIASEWKTDLYTIPTMIPPVVPNALLLSGSYVRFVDHPNWVGDSYILSQNKLGFRIIDSAQKAERNQFKNEAFENDLMIFSNYPTKPVGGCDGGIVVSNDKSKIDHLRELTFNGMSTELNNWERKQTSIGWKMYMNSLQAHIANENLKKLDEKKTMLAKIRDIYNSAFGLNNTSDHLYRINVSNREDFLNRAKEAEIVCGIHYSCAHQNPVFNQTNLSLPNSEKESLTTISLPFHEKLRLCDIEKVIKLVNG